MRNVKEQDCRDFRTILVDNIRRQLPEEPVGLAMSGGIDSASVFFALIELGHQFECYTFCQNGYESEDLIESRKYCDKYNIKLNVIYMPSDLDSVYRDIRYVIPFCGVKLKKTKVETLRPLMYLFEKAKHKVILNGYAADEYQPYSRKCNILYGKDKNEQAVLDAEWRRRWLHKDEYMVLSKKFAENYGINFIDCYDNIVIENFFLKFKLSEILKPHKHIVTSAFENEFKAVGGFRYQSSYQVNSKTTSVHNELLNSKYNINKHKGIIGLYNEIKQSLKQYQLEL